MLFITTQSTFTNKTKSQYFFINFLKMIKYFHKFTNIFKIILS